MTTSKHLPLLLVFNSRRLSLLPFHFSLTHSQPCLLMPMFSVGHNQLFVPPILFTVYHLFSLRPPCQGRPSIQRSLRVRFDLTA